MPYFTLHMHHRRNLTLRFKLYINFWISIPLKFYFSFIILIMMFSSKGRIMDTIVPSLSILTNSYRDRKVQNLSKWDTYNFCTSAFVQCHFDTASISSILRGRNRIPKAAIQDPEKNKPNFSTISLHIIQSNETIIFRLCGY